MSDGLCVCLWTRDRHTPGPSPTDPLSFSLTHLPLSVIVKQEGVLGLWKGAAPTMGRATTLAAVEMSSYDEVSTTILLSTDLHQLLSASISTLPLIRRWPVLLPPPFSDQAAADCKQHHYAWHAPGCADFLAGLWLSMRSHDQPL